MSRGRTFVIRLLALFLFILLPANARAQPGVTALENCELIQHMEDQEPTCLGRCGLLERHGGTYVCLDKTIQEWGADSKNACHKCAPEIMGTTSGGVYDACAGLCAIAGEFKYFERVQRDFNALPKDDSRFLTLLNDCVGRSPHVIACRACFSKTGDMSACKGCDVSNLPLVNACRAEARRRLDKEKKKDR
jgi:hypothetical protein